MFNKYCTNWHIYASDMDAQRRNYGECVWERNTVAVTDKSAIVCNCVQGHGGLAILANWILDGWRGRARETSLTGNFWLQLGRWWRWGEQMCFSLADQHDGSDAGQWPLVMLILIKIVLIFRLIFAEIFGDQLLIIDATNKKIVKSWTASYS